MLAPPGERCWMCDTQASEGLGADHYRTWALLAALSRKTANERPAVSEPIMLSGWSAPRPSQLGSLYRLVGLLKQPEDRSEPALMEAEAPICLQKPWFGPC